MSVIFFVPGFKRTLTGARAHTQRNTHNFTGGQISKQTQTGRATSGSKEVAKAGKVDASPGWRHNLGAI